jgi:hypothetical protein
MTELVLWAAEHEETENPELVRLIKAGKQEFLAGIYKRLAQ